jgi:uncharacterized membrane protein YedE/YeeE
MTSFTPISSLIGGALIGVAATILLVLNGRIAGISGILGGALRGTRDERTWRLLFLGGLVIAGAVFPRLAPGGGGAGLRAPRGPPRRVRSR